MLGGVAGLEDLCRRKWLWIYSISEAEVLVHRFSTDSVIPGQDYFRDTTAGALDQFGRTFRRQSPFSSLVHAALPGQGDPESDIGPYAGDGAAWAWLGHDGSEYFDLHHTPDDTLDKIDPQALAQNVAAYTVFAYLAAQAEGDFGSAPGRVVNERR